MWKFTTNFIKKQTSRKQSSSYFMAEAKCKQSVDTCKVVATQRVKNAKEIKLEFYGNVRHETLSNQNLDKLKEKERKIWKTCTNPLLIWIHLIYTGKVCLEFLQNSTLLAIEMVQGNRKRHIKISSMKLFMK